MKTTLKIMVLFISILLTSCNANLNIGDGIEGSGNVITEKRKITETFTKIEASTGVEVILEQGNTTEIEVEIDDNLIEYVITKVENGTLIAKIDGNITTSEVIIIRIKTAEIDGLKASSGASIRSKNTLRGTNIAVETSSGSVINADLEYEKVVSEASSGSEITLSGKALIVETSSSSGSTINAKDLAANEITAESSSGSNTTVNPIVFLNAKATSGSTIEYIQNAKKIIKKEGFGGSIFKK